MTQTLWSVINSRPVFVLPHDKSYRSFALVPFIVSLFYQGFIALQSLSFRNEFSVGTVRPVREGLIRISGDYLSQAECDK